MGYILKIIVYLLWFGIALYFGIGGYVALDIEDKHKKAREQPEKIVDYHGIEFKNEAIAQVHSDEVKAMGYFRILLNNLPTNLLYLFTAMAFGVLGVITRINKEIAMDKVLFKDIEVYFSPILGLMIGILILAISRIIPNLLVDGESNVEPLTLAFLSLIAGFSSKQFYEWLVKSTQSIFKK
ncbi:hypothetical protein [Flagellimonas sp. 2504JD4-2]